MSEEHPALGAFRRPANQEEVKRHDEFQKDARNIEIGLLKLVLTLSGGTLAVSIGFALGDQRVDISLPVIADINCAWVLLLISMVSALISWLLTSLSMFNQSRQTTRRFRGEGETSAWRLRLTFWMDSVATALVFTSILICICGLALLGRAALALLEGVSRSVPLAL